MIKFLLKGIRRDKNRSMLPIVVIAIGVTLTVTLVGYIRGYMGDMIRQSARFQTGHVKVITKAYSKNMDQLPIDMALLEVDSIVATLTEQYPDITWVQRIRFGGLIDVPDKNGATKTQGPASGMAIDMFTPEGSERKRMNLKSALTKGTVPNRPGEIVIGQEFADKLNIDIGDRITYIGTTINGSMTFKNFTVSGMIHFGLPAMDKSTMIVDIKDTQQMFDMDNGASEILGFLNNDVYIKDKVNAIATSFNAMQNTRDEFAPVMLTLGEQNNLGSYIDMTDAYAQICIMIFIFSMSLVLWNTGLLGGLRRYQEFGIRLALGESKGAIYRSLVAEAIAIGIIGSIAGTGIGIAITLYIQHTGIDISAYVANSTLMNSSVLRSEFSPDLLYLGFIPGLLAMVTGNMLSGIGIYKRKTAVLFQELEA